LLSINKYSYLHARSQFMLMEINRLAVFVDFHQHDQQLQHA